VPRKSVQPAPWNSGESRTIPPGSSARPVEFGREPDYSTGEFRVQEGPHKSRADSSFELSPFSFEPSSPPSFPASQLSSFFVELPYTLPQDFTLFILMREKDAGVWKNKVDWIAKKGGMALLNTHPDYMNFYTRKCSTEEYPASYYLEFLKHINRKYEKNHCHCLPRQIADYCGTTAREMREQHFLQSESAVHKFSLK
jgi:hypothetical protein